MSESFKPLSSVLRASRATVAAIVTVGALGAASLAHAELNSGDPAPDFKAQASIGGKVFAFSLDEALKKGPVVLYFYPAAFTKGCTIEAHLFADAVDRFHDYHATVIGVSHDDIETLNQFSVSECRSKFAVAADPDRSIMKAYDAAMPEKQMAKRVSYVIEPDGRIWYSYSSMDPEQHVNNTLRALDEYQKEHGGSN
ncbi:peroxiredoxin [Pararobbsia silviterrae]|uniref:thioredoxin-dependent peroxiredoxin n=1 Tax=Pararobbsia silviterrae TaxID=1792498 RepID=A0A494XPZ7_9BURK|nr:peroxiredoxin [Pararobbsia silviterrae]RKP50229.1 peroxiredoxin [Pararobbsia silviterrae]